MATLKTYVVEVGHRGNGDSKKYNVFAWTQEGANETAARVCKDEFPDYVVLSVDLVPDEVEELPGEDDAE